ncbi:VWA domain-containing protein [Streptosporangium saharense]|uniref:VWA domain-containing protein n=1 Tax=Streptosporangium saharense TaxID=1706840 RepID=UPI003333826D
MGKFKDLMTKAGRWLRGGSAAALAPPATAAVVADRFDGMEWREVYDQAAALRGLVDELGETNDHAGDLVRDLWTAAYKTAPQLRPREEMDPSRLVNHQVLESLTTSPEWAELHRETAGDAYAAAMAVLAQAGPLRQLLERTKEAQQAAQAVAQAQQAAAEAAAQVQAALEAAAETEDDQGEVDQAAATAVSAAIEAAEAAQAVADAAAEQAQAALAQSGPAVRATIRAAAEAATEQAQAEAALMTAWGIDPGQLTRLDFEARRRLADRLRGGRLAAFADLLGRFRQMAKGERARRIEHAQGELVGVTLGDDISKAIPSELASLGVPALRPVFAAKVAEGRLMTYETRGDERAGQGPIIALIDTSWSMTETHGGISREAWAKAATLALMDQARASRRHFSAILFSSASTPPQLFEFRPGRTDIEQTLELAETFLGGGTSFMVPLDLAAQVLEREHAQTGHTQADIVLITDGEARLTEEWMRTWQERKHRLGFRVFALAIAQEPGPVLEALADDGRRIDDLADVGQVADVFRVV